MAGPVAAIAGASTAALAQGWTTKLPDRAIAGVRSEVMVLGTPHLSGLPKEGVARAALAPDRAAGDLEAAGDRDREPLRHAMRRPSPVSHSLRGDRRAILPRSGGGGEGHRPRRSRRHGGGGQAVRQLAGNSLARATPAAGRHLAGRREGHVALVNGCACPRRSAAPTRR
ncbi:hypothetical protein AB5I41_03635 [Sphingomonas sp. MMS24-JH45]